MAVADYLLTPYDIWRGLRWMYQRIREAKRYDWIGIVLIIGSAWFLAGNVSLSLSVFVLFGLVVVYWNIDVRLPSTLAVVCLLLVPIQLFLFSQGMFPFGDTTAEVTATWAFYFLGISGIKLVIDQVWHRENGITTTQKISRRKKRHIEYDELTIAIKPRKKPRKRVVGMEDVIRKT